MSDAIPQLIRLLDSADQRELKRAGDRLTALGARARPELLRALCSSSARTRKAAAFLLGRHHADEVVTALGAAVVADEEPKVRKNAAVSLGALGDTGAIPALADALGQESIGWVRQSIILALGVIGGEQAHAALRSVMARDEGEREALRKALDRALPRVRAMTWRRDDFPPLPLTLEVPTGLEQVALAEAAEHGLGGLTREAAGRLRCPERVRPWETLPALRTIYGVRIPAGAGPPFDLDDPQSAATIIARMVSESQVLHRLRNWIATEEDVLQFRFAVERPHIKREALRRIIEAVRQAARPLGLVDSPSNYDLELLVDSDEHRATLALRPSFMPDERFDYRVKDVGAAIHPVVAACLARLVRTRDNVTVFDPTCGSATLLIERARLGPVGHLIGLDVSPTAIGAAKANTTAASLSGQVELHQGSADDPRSWPACEEVIANLPFGMRTRREELDLETLYKAIAAQLARQLQPGGRALLYTANQKLLDAALSRNADRLRVVERQRVLSGGLWCHIWVLTRR